MVAWGSCFIPLHPTPVARRKVAAGVGLGFKRSVDVHVSGLTLMGLLVNLFKIPFKPQFAVSAAVLVFLRISVSTDAR